MYYLLCFNKNTVHIALSIVNKLLTTFDVKHVIANIEINLRLINAVEDLFILS